MKKTLLEIYALVVCLGTITCFSIFLGIGIYDIIELSVPAVTLESYDHERHQTNDRFTKSWHEGKREKYTEAQISKLREDSYQVALQTERRKAMQSLIRILIIITIDSIIFLFHWKIARESKASSASIE